MWASTPTNCAFIELCRRIPTFTKCDFISTNRRVRCPHRTLRFTDLEIFFNSLFIPTVSSRHLPLQQGEAGQVSADFKFNHKIYVLPLGRCGHRPLRIVLLSNFAVGYQPLRNVTLFQQIVGCDAHIAPRKSDDILFRIISADFKIKSHNFCFISV